MAESIPNFSKDGKELLSLKKKISDSLKNINKINSEIKERGFEHVSNEKLALISAKYKDAIRDSEQELKLIKNLLFNLQVIGESRKDLDDVFLKSPDHTPEISKSKIKTIPKKISEYFTPSPTRDHMLSPSRFNDSSKLEAASAKDRGYYSSSNENYRSSKGRSFDHKNAKRSDYGEIFDYQKDQHEILSSIKIKKKNSSSHHRSKSPSEKGNANGTSSYSDYKRNKPYSSENSDDYKSLKTHKSNHENRSPSSSGLNKGSERSSSKPRLSSQTKGDPYVSSSSSKTKRSYDNDTDEYSSKNSRMKSGSHEHKHKVRPSRSSEDQKRRNPDISSRPKDTSSDISSRRHESLSLSSNSRSHKPSTSKNGRESSHDYNRSSRTKTENGNPSDHKDVSKTKPSEGSYIAKGHGPSKRSSSESSKLHMNNWISEKDSESYSNKMKSSSKLTQLRSSSSKYGISNLPKPNYDSNNKSENKTGSSTNLSRVHEKNSSASSQRQASNTGGSKVDISTSKASSNDDTPASRFSESTIQARPVSRTRSGSSAENPNTEKMSSSAMNEKRGSIQDTSTKSSNLSSSSTPKVKVTKSQLENQIDIGSFVAAKIPVDGGDQGEEWILGIVRKINSNRTKFVVEDADDDELIAQGASNKVKYELDHRHVLFVADGLPPEKPVSASKSSGSGSSRRKPSISNSSDVSAAKNLSKGDKLRVSAIQAINVGDRILGIYPGTTVFYHGTVQLTPSQNRGNLQMFMNGLPLLGFPPVVLSLINRWSHVYPSKPLFQVVFDNDEGKIIDVPAIMIIKK
ncbi:hypothetical protein BB560_001832 [Smittium megazygosporum]|uniref:SGF29 C-terminal domain-containing protein n=1 Tax=Smittium megazygosporum TaxID=133381 RepID=A0A2T9ZGG3_9FUNG|nr:hypothetical protein BB560_001832 [Smittium megazygosporum]